MSYCAVTYAIIDAINASEFCFLLDRLDAAERECEFDLILDCLIDTAILEGKILSDCGRQEKLMFAEGNDAASIVDHYAQQWMHEYNLQLIN
jgi:hypothetical protein